MITVLIPRIRLHGQDIDFINFNNFANTHSQSVIETPKEGAYPTAAGMMMRMFSKTQAYRTLVLEDYHPTRNDAVQVQLSINQAQDALILNILNRSEEDGEIELDLSSFSVMSGHANGNMLVADGLLSMNRIYDMQINEIIASLTITNCIVKCAVPKLSYAEYTIELTESIH